MRIKLELPEDIAHGLPRRMIAFGFQGMSISGPN